MKAAIYTRISSDPSGQKAGVARQEKECRQLIEDRDWDLVRVYTDNDRSAYSGKPRPEYERLLEDVRAGGGIEAVVAWHPDRLHRSPTELEAFIDLVESKGVAIATVQGGQYDLTTPSGRMTARVVGAVARHESEHKSERQKSKAAELARQGKPSGGGDRPYGYESDRVTIREDEATYIRQAAKRLLRGESQRSIVRDWNDAGVLSVRGGAWSSPQLKRMMRSARIAGLRSHKGEVVAQAEWPGIIDEADHYAIVALLEQNRRHSREPRKYLLTGGIAKCGLCGANLVARPRGDGTRCYVCASPPNFSGCGKIRAIAEPLEDWVRDAVIVAVAGEGLTAAMDDVDVDSVALVEEISGLEGSLEQLARDHYAENRIGAREYFAARDAIDTRIEGLKADLAVGQAGRFAADLPTNSEALQELYDSQALGWQRQLVDMVVESVIANPAVRGRNFFEAGRFEIRWRV